MDSLVHMTRDLKRIAKSWEKEKKRMLKEELINIEANLEDIYEQNLGGIFQNEMIKDVKG